MDEARIIGLHSAKIVHAPPDDLDLGVFGLPQIVDAIGGFFEEVAGGGNQQRPKETQHEFRWSNHHLRFYAGRWTC